MRLRRRAKLTDEELSDLYSDLALREKLRRVLSDNSKDVLGLELGISEASVARMDRLDYCADRCPRIEPDIVKEVRKRRKVYWEAREVYDSRCTNIAIMSRYGISKSTLVRRLKEVRQAQRKEVRRAA